MKKALVLLLLLSLAFSAACSSKAGTGAGVGALAGGLVGAMASGDKLIGAGIGAGIGAALGYMIGNEWDKRDQRELNRTLEYQPSGQTSSWVNPDSGRSYRATPQPAYEYEGRTWREVVIESEDAKTGEPVKVRAKAYRQPDGTWELQQ